MLTGLSATGLQWVGGQPLDSDGLGAGALAQLISEDVCGSVLQLLDLDRCVMSNTSKKRMLGFAWSNLWS